MTDLALFFDELFQVLDEADIGLNIPGDGAGVHASVPAPYAELPHVIYGEPGPGLDRILDLGLLIVFGPANNSHVFRTALAYASTSGTKSIKKVLEAHDWTTVGTVYVGNAEPTIENLLGANPALGYTFHIDITGAAG